MKVTNRFKGLDLIDRVPEEQRTEVPDTVREAVIKTIPTLSRKCFSDAYLTSELQLVEGRTGVSPGPGSQVTIRGQGEHGAAWALAKCQGQKDKEGTLPTRRRLKKWANYLPHVPLAGSWTGIKHRL